MKHRLSLVCILVLVASACGKKGPPLPPIVRLPAAPGDFVASRRGASVVITLAVPSSNTDGSTPADLLRVDVYALTGPQTSTPDEIVRRGTRVGSVAVNPARDPEEEEDVERTDKKTLPNGVDQNATTHLFDAIGQFATDPSFVRSYLAVGVNLRGRRGAFSERALVPLDEPPPAPALPTVTWSEKTITVAWAPVISRDRTLAYHVYVPGDVEQRLSNQPLSEGKFEERRREWGMERCYMVRTIVVDQMSIESEASPRACVTPIDTFPPAAPTGLQAVASQGAVDLIWNPNNEDDLGGYFVLRAIAPDSSLRRVNAEPLQEATFRDTVPSGARLTYAIQAVDEAGNVGPMSDPIRESVR